jgi:hypothetical protein
LAVEEMGTGEDRGIREGVIEEERGVESMECLLKSDDVNFSFFFDYSFSYSSVFPCTHFFYCQSCNCRYSFLNVICPSLCLRVNRKRGR